MSYIGLVHGAYAGLTYWLREETTDPALLEEARRITTELEQLAPRVLRGLPLASAGDDGGLRAVANSGKSKRGGAGIVAEDSSEGLHVAGWCNELPQAEAAEETQRPAKLELTLLLVNSGSGRRGGVRIVAPSSARWLEAKAAYALGIISTPQADEAELVLQRSSDYGSGPEQLQVSDSVPLPKYGVRLYTVTIDAYVPPQSNPQEDGGRCDGWVRQAAAEREEARAKVQALKSEL